MNVSPTPGEKFFYLESKNKVRDKAIRTEVDNSRYGLFQFN